MADAGLRRRHRLHARLLQRAPRAQLRIQRHLAGVDATPLWIPQLGMAAGAVVLAIAFLDDLLLMSLGKTGRSPGEAQPGTGAHGVTQRGHP